MNVLTINNRKRSSRVAKTGSILCFIVMPFLMASCLPKAPENIISESEMENLLYDYHLAQAMAESHDDSVGYYRYLYVSMVFEKYGVCEADFDSSMVWYTANAAILSQMYERINERYAQELKRSGTNTIVADVYSNLGTAGDTANIWNDAAFYMIKQGETENYYAFTIHADTSFYQGDDMVWRFKPYFVGKSKDMKAVASFSLHFTNDSVAAKTETFWTNSTVELRVNGRKDKIKSLSGFVYMPSPENKKDNDFRMLLLNDFQLIRFHKKQSEPDSVLNADSVKQDTIVQMPDSAVHADKVVPADTAQEKERHSPRELRDKQPNERKINVVREKPYRVRQNR